MTPAQIRELADDLDCEILRACADLVEVASTDDFGSDEQGFEHALNVALRRIEEIAP